MMEIWWTVTLLLSSAIPAVSGIVNVALNKPANMSSSYGSPALPAGGAVDGNITAVHPNIIHTALGRNFAWWTVDLQGDVQEATVEIYFRTDYTRRRIGTTVYTSVLPFSSYPGGQLCHMFNGSDIPDVVNTTCPRTWRYLMIYTDTLGEGGAVLDFGEVIVLGCLNGTYGQQCNKSCDERHCINSSSPCDPLSGRCEQGCQPGWIGTDCMEACSNGTYGMNCTSACGNCATEDTCNHITGSCPGACRSGWRLDLCQEVCLPATYGFNCNSSCGKCQGDACNHVDGTCLGGCQTGWQASLCQEKCSFGFYGSGCRTRCGNCDGSCDHVTGNCDACKDGWELPTCSKRSAAASDFPSSPDNGDHFPIVAVAGGVAAAALVLIAVIAVVCFVFRRRRKRPASGSGNSSASDDSSPSVDNATTVTPAPGTVTKTLPTNMKLKPEVNADIPSDSEEENLDDEMLSPDDNCYYNMESEDFIREIAVADLEATVRRIKLKEGGFGAEFSRLPTGFTALYGDATKPENAGKNKFQGYYPYNYNRVRLPDLPGVPGSDYINASFMHNYNETKTYIAAQAPNKNTLVDFWRMIWEHKCNRIIMLTNLVELTRVKCKQYWPSDGVMDTGYFQIEVEETDVRANYTVRHFKVTRNLNGESRSVVQYHYTLWPDHDVPDTLALVNFIWMIRRTDTQTDGHLLIHCSAGIGRTGTYIAVDSLVDQAREERKVDVLGYVSVMRGQRKNMIQTKEQYECVLQCLVEMTKFGDTSMDVENFTDIYSNRGMDSIIDRKTFRELNQLVLDESYNDDPDSHRIWVDGNQDFVINTTPSLRQVNGYLLAMFPPRGLEKLLWKLVVENSVQNIVVLSPQQVQLYGKPKTTMKYDSISLKTMSQTLLPPDLTQVTLQLHTDSKTKENTHTVRLYTFSEPVTMETMITSLTNHAHLQNLVSDAHPVILIHSDWKNAASYSIVSNIMSGVLEDQQVDVIGHVRQVLQCVPVVTLTEEDVIGFYRFAQMCAQLTSSANTYANL